MEFNRTNSKKYLDSLQNSDLYKKLLKDDKDIFMAFRKSEIDFYYKGSRIYKYTSKGFSSHKKYSLNTVYKNDILLDDLSKNKIEIIKDILENHEYIKKNGKEKSKKEDKGISNLYSQDYFSQNEIFLLDIEIALYDNESKDRIDLLLYDNKNCVLKFIEAKDYSNKELWSKEKEIPDVVKQINRYNKRLNDKNIYDKILNEYTKYIEILRNQFNLEINIPKKIEKEVSLYMFGFDNEQKNRINRLLIKNNSLGSIPYYFYGDSSSVKIENLFSINHNEKN